MKTFQTMILALAAAAQANALYSGDFAYEINPGGTNVTITGFVGDGTMADIPSEIGGKPVVAIGGRAFNGQAGLTSATIPDSVETIGAEAFSHCSGLQGVQIGNGITHPNRYYRLSMP